MAQLVRNLPAMQQIWVQSLDWEDLLEKGKATHSSILAWRIPWASLIAQLVKNPPAMPVDLASIPGLGRYPGEGKSYPLQYFGLENSMDSPWGHKELDTTERLTHTEIISIESFL